MRLFDTDFLIDLVDGDQEADEKARLVDEEETLNAISITTVHEYLRGIFHLYSKDEELLQEKLKRAEAELARFKPLPYTYEIAKTAAEIDAKLMKKGTPLSFPDIVIAATALHHKLSLVTRNVKHYEKIPDLKVETY